MASASTTTTGFRSSAPQNNHQNTTSCLSPNKHGLIIRDVGDLRSLVNAPTVDKEELWLLINELCEQDTHVYHSTYVPYLAGFPHLFNIPLATLYDQEELQDAINIAPFACFKLQQQGVMTQLQSQALAQNANLSFVRHLDISNNDLEPSESSTSPNHPTSRH